MAQKISRFYPSCNPVILAPKFFCPPNGCISYWQSSPTRQNSSLQSFSTDHFEYASWKRHSQVLMRIRKATKKRSILVTKLPLKYRFCSKSFLERWTSDQLNTFTTYVSSLLGVIAIEFSNHAQNWGQIQCSTGQRFIFPKWLCYKIHTLITLPISHQLKIEIVVRGQNP